MKKRRGAEQIVGLLRQADVALERGEKVPEVCKQMEISRQTNSSANEVRRNGSAERYPFTAGGPSPPYNRGKAP
jgi:hypothetical protein